MYFFVHPTDAILGVEGNSCLVAHNGHRIWRVIADGKVEVDKFVFRFKSDRKYNVEGETELLVGKSPFRSGKVRWWAQNEAEFNSSQSLTTDIASNIYISDIGNHRI